MIGDLQGSTFETRKTAAWSRFMPLTLRRNEGFVILVGGPRDAPQRCYGGLRILI